ncbi:hypothetical protein [Vulcaniibacterium tengchongense]|uniref:Uncharacterized protein n=1 Tax=Vulcaniibacterium tengchongense TaxID=1273429 RepID=A0A3N4VE73_9GAMM|nr:hypothetical protein [Vulcaniibacterium tengchongense]RPE80103.1 hypothetical protein EDC50_1935 [Vulcaniibacterium tengchongense]
MSKLTSLPERAMELAGAVGENIRQAMPAVGRHTGRWIETGATIGAVKTGARAAGMFVRRNPVLVAAAVAGAGLLWYAAHRRRQRLAAQGDDAEALEGSARRIDARRAERSNGGARARTGTRRGGGRSETHAGPQ